MYGILRFSGAVKRNPSVEVWMKERAADEKLGAIARKWFLRMRGCGDDVLELVHDGCAVVCVGDAPFASVNVFKAHVNAGFFYGAFLEDPAHLLEGAGKRIRHVKLKPGADDSALGALIDAAYADIKSRLS